MNQYFGFSVSAAAPRHTGILPRRRDFQVLLKIPEKRHLARNMSLISQRSSRQLAGQSPSNWCNPPDLRPSHGVLSSLISRTQVDAPVVRWHPRLWFFSAVTVSVWLLCITPLSAGRPESHPLQGESQLDYPNPSRQQRVAQVWCWRTLTGGQLQELQTLLTEEGYLMYPHNAAADKFWWQLHYVAFVSVLILTISLQLPDTNVYFGALAIYGGLF